ncbi:MAG: glycosyltransferase family 2 protein [Clostridia bacterium]|nr:glycosyltransferase family 2 protein [Clostridia bacterium]
MQGVVSVIIPVYNRENYIEECLLSVINQTYKALEIIVVDDGSTDRTFELCKSVRSGDGRITLIKGDHGGVSAARNKALDAATGEYVIFVDSDDVIYPTAIESLVKGFEETDALIGGIGIANISEKNWQRVKERLAEASQPTEYTYRSHDDTLKALFQGEITLGLAGGNMLRRDLIGDTRFKTDLFIGEDYYFIYENVIKGATSVFLNKKRYYCRFHSGNSSDQFDFNGFWTRFHRRELVWKSEEAFGRKEYANIQKQDAFGCFLRCFNNRSATAQDRAEMCKVLRQYKKEILPAFGLKSKIKYLMYAYIPSVARALFKRK